MIQISELYALPFKQLKLTDWVIRDSWFPDMPGLLDCWDSDTLAHLETDSRFQIRELVNDYIDGHRVLEMVTLWFDGAPVMVAQAAGRSGRDHQRRWVTNREKYWALVCYLIEHSKPLDNDDYVDAESWVFEDEVFTIQGVSLAERFGYSIPPKTKGYLVLGHQAGKLVPAAQNKNMVLVGVTAQMSNPSEYIRREGYVMQLQRPLSSEELQSNPKLTEYEPEESPMTWFWYEQAKLPTDVSKVISV